jgi:hypothetical protein
MIPRRLPQFQRAKSSVFFLPTPHQREPFTSQRVKEALPQHFQIKFMGKRCFWLTYTALALLLSQFSFRFGSPGSDADLGLNRPGFCGIPILPTYFHGLYLSGDNDSLARSFFFLS